MLCRYFLDFKTQLGAAVPGFFADQSIEVLDSMVKTVYNTVLWTAHVLLPVTLISSLQSMQ